VGNRSIEEARWRLVWRRRRRLALPDLASGLTNGFAGRLTNGLAGGLGIFLFFYRLTKAGVLKSPPL
jgi:hypothetical protein